MRARSMLLALALSLPLGCTGGGGDGGGDPVDARPQIDADPICATLDSRGGFPDCSVCESLGNGCDTIDVNGQVSRVCDCSAPCPCGLRCGSIEIAPNVVVGNICIR